MDNKLLLKNEVFVSLGSNQGERIRYLALGVAALKRIGCGVICSPVYETTPVGWIQQPPFLNMVVRLETELSPRALLTELLKIEHEHGRVRAVRFGPRTLDLDILLYNNEYVCFQDLQIPHPRMWQRAFVLVPCADLIPARRGLGGKRFDELAAEIFREGDVQYVGRFW